MKISPDKTVRECSALEISEAFTLHMIGAAKKLRTYRALTLDPFQPTAVFYGLVAFGALPDSSPYWFSGSVVAIEHGAANSPSSVQYKFEKMRQDKQFPLIGTPTYLSEGEEFYDDSVDYQQRLQSVLSVAGSLEAAYAGMVTLLGWSGRMLVHRELGEYQISDEIFHPERFVTTPFYEKWLDSKDIKGVSIENEMLARLRSGGVALVSGLKDSAAFVCWKGEWRRYESGNSKACKETAPLKTLRSLPDGSLLAIPAAEAYLGYPLTP